MKTILCCLLLFTTATAHARLGETIAQCKARYGEEIARDNEEKYLGFHKNGFVIMAYFDDQSLCKKLIFFQDDKSALSDYQKDFLVEANFGKGAVKSFIGIEESWTDNKTGLAIHSLLYKTLTFMTLAAAQEYLQEIKAEQLQTVEGF